MSNETPANRGIAVLLGALAASMFFSTALINVGAALVSIVALVHWFRDRPFHLLRHPLAVTSLAFVGWVVLRDLLAGESPLAAVRAANGVRPLLFVVLWAPLFQAERNRRAVVAACAGGMAVFCLVAIATLLATGKPLYDHHVNPADVVLPGFLMAGWKTFFTRAPDLAGPILLAVLFGSLQVAWDGARHRRFWYVLATLAAITLLFATARRTSQLGFLLCALLFVALNWRRINPRAAVLLAVAGALSVGLAAFSPTVAKGVRQVATDFREFSETPVEQQGRLWSSGGERLRYWSVAGRLARESPWLGTGASAFPVRFLAQEKAMGGSHKPQANPHNEYLYVLAALGAVGLVLYLAAHGAALKAASDLRNTTQRKILYLYLLAALVSIVFNSMLVDMIPGHFHALALLTLGWFEGPAARPDAEVAA